MADDYEHYESFAEFVEFTARVREISREEACVGVRLLRRIPRDRQNPIELYAAAEFLLRYRFSKQAVQQLLLTLPLQTNTDRRGCPVPPLLQLLVALRFYGAGTFQIVSGDLVNISQPTVSRIIARISTMIAGSLFPELVDLPDATEVPQVMRDFYAIAKFPGVTGCLDCTHVRIKSPGGDDAEVYRNRKGYFSINVQAITGPQLQFFNIVASWPGSTHDSRIFDNSNVRALYEEGVAPGILLGDMGYPCREYLMTPLKDPGSTRSPEYTYNKSHIKTRNSVERAFGVWKRRFPCLDMKLQIKTELVPVVITACAALHNFGRKRNDPVPSDVPSTSDSQHPPDDMSILSGSSTQPDTVSGFRARSRIIRDYFS